ncbi:hypothetical protein BTVI_71779 [Pitangus sulphuratus]|nr:hypothetical protein BTVI_71779 [Pitangus sulphuratus]
MPRVEKESQASSSDFVAPEYEHFNRGKAAYLKPEIWNPGRNIFVELEGEIFNNQSPIRLCWDKPLEFIRVSNTQQKSGRMKLHKCFAQLEDSSGCSGSAGAEGEKVRIPSLWWPSQDSAEVSPGFEPKLGLVYNQPGPKLQMKGPGSVSSKGCSWAGGSSLV